MPELIVSPSVVPGVEPKLIEEFVGVANTGSTDISVARMVGPQGWTEPGQRPDFDEITLVLQGTIQVETEGDTLQVTAGQALVTRAGEWVRYSTPHEGGAEYIAICTPAFNIEGVNRDDD